MFFMSSYIKRVRVSTAADTTILLRIKRDSTQNLLQPKKLKRRPRKQQQKLMLKRTKQMPAQPVQPAQPAQPVQPAKPA